MTKRIFIESTHTYGTDLLTGIQRVVRNVVKNSDSDKFSGVSEISPVIFIGDELFKVSKDSLDLNLNDAKSQYLAAKLNISLVIWLKDTLRKKMYPVFKLLKGAYLRLRLRVKKSSYQGLPLALSKTDTLVFLDASWGRDFWQTIQSHRANGVSVVFVLYDLIPITHESLYAEERKTEFELFVKQMLLNSDKVLCISKAVQDELFSYIANNQSSLISQKLPKIDFFHLGVDFKIPSSGFVRQELKDIFIDSDTSVFLMVSTIEPRKNHQYLLDVFESLWLSGSSSKLLIVGRIGWDVKDLIKRISSNALLNKKLFMFNDVNDEELGYCYEHSTSLVFPSMIEGFGLPVIESLQKGLPVIASDIPAHREIGQDNIMYLDLNRHESLSELISNIEVSGVDNRFQPRNFKWMDWEEATHNFLTRIMK